jgi:erythromycin esterase-like protein
MESFDLNDLELAFDEDAVAELRNPPDRLLLLGEAHGVEETPRVIAAVMRRVGFRALALEWDAALAPAIEGYLGGRGLSVEDARAQLDFTGTDGRVTAGHFALLRQLNADGALDQLILFNADGDSFDERDRAMADRLLGALVHGRPTLIVAGAAHTRRTLQPWGVPMGTHVAAVVPDVAEGEIEYFGGSCLNMTVKRIPERKPPAAPRFYRRTDGSFVAEVRRAHPAAVPGLDLQLPSS